MYQCTINRKKHICFRWKPSVRQIKGREKKTTSSSCFSYFSFFTPSLFLSTFSAYYLLSLNFFAILFTTLKLVSSPPSPSFSFLFPHSNHFSFVSFSFFLVFNFHSMHLFLSISLWFSLRRTLIFPSTC